MYKKDKKGHIKSIKSRLTDARKDSKKYLEGKWEI